MSIDTIFRKDYNTTNNNDYIYILPQSVNNVISMILCSAEIPFTWYLFTEKNNKFIIQTTNAPYIYEDNPGIYDYSPEMEYTITIPPGNWTSEVLNAKMQAYLNTQSFNTGLPWLYFNIEDITGKTIIRLKTYNEILDLIEDENSDINITEEQLNVYLNTDNSLKTDGGQIIFRTDYEIYNSTENNCNNVHPKETCLWTMGFRKTHYVITQDRVYSIEIM